MLFGYARKSKTSQKLDLQIDALLKYGVKEKNIYTDAISGSKSERKNFDILLSKLREGDTFVTWKLDRVARSVSHLTKLINDFKKEGIDFVSIQEPFLDTTTSYGKFIFTMFSGIAELERDIIIERTLAGQESARKRGVKFGRKRGLTEKAKKKAILAETYYRDETKKLSVDEICKLCDIGSKATLYRYLMYQGRRNCVVCDAYFWDKEQEPDNAYCEKHIHQKREAQLLEKVNK
jgi:DNA invertase Pin-like site-specific DNA recombinase